MRFLDINKGDAENVEIRSRLVVQETRKKTTIDPTDVGAVFAASPPYEAMRFLLNFAMAFHLVLGYLSKNARS